MSVGHNSLTRFGHMTELILASPALRSTLEQVVSAISADIVKCNSVGIYLPQADGNFRGFVGKPTTISGITIDQMVISPESDALVREMLEKNQPIYINDTSLDHRPDPIPVEMFSIKSLLALPISFEGEIFGLLFLFNSGFVLDITEAEIRSIEAYVDMAAFAIRNMYLTSQKELLLDATRELSVCTTTQAVLDSCFIYMEKALFNANIGIHISDGNGGFVPTQLSKNSSWTENDWKSVHKEVRVDFARDLVFQEVVRTKRPIFIPDVQADPRPNQQACKEFGIKGLFIMPLVAMGDVLGTVAVVNLANQEVYTPSEILLAESIANAAASALSNLSRMDRLEQIVRERTEEIQEKNVELERVVQRLVQLGHQNDVILNTVAEGIYGLDTNGQVTFCNPSAAKMIGRTVSDVTGQDVNSVFQKRTVWLRDFFQFAHGSVASHNPVMSDALVRADGSQFLVEYSSTPIVEDGTVAGEVVTIRDVTRRRMLEMQIEYQAFYDTLTGLPNRYLFTQQLSSSMEQASDLKEQLALMFLDLDQFKIINDTLGHGHGDQVLKEVAQRLNHCVGRPNVVFRLGGDEFTIVLHPVENDAEVERIAQDILVELSRPFVMNNSEFYVSPSIGIGVYPRDGVDSETLLKHADLAMYRAKQSGVHYELYNSSMTNQMVSRVALEREYERALDHNEFVLFYQPQIDLRSGRIVGMEALIRCDSPTKGILLPGEFIPQIEKTGVIVALEEWVIATACAQAKIWNVGPSPIRMSVNLSARQFDNKNLVDTIRGILKETELNPNLLELELTESIILQNSESVMSTMQELSDLGVRISIDDFGTGYSSLAYLRDFPIHTLKIDRMFVEKLGEPGKNVAITSSIISLASHLGLRSVAEGVETHEQLAFLKEHGCDEAQGYFYSRPLPVTEITPLIRKMNQN